MKHVLSGAAALLLCASLVGASLAHAQTAASSPSAAPGTGAPANSMGAPPTPSPAPSITGNTNSKAAASGNDNQAVVTTGANADQPAQGANSFSRGEARHRIAAKGYTGVKSLKKDSGGVWRGTAMKDGQPVQVWLDYKGNVGQQS